MLTVVLLRKKNTFQFTFEYFGRENCYCFAFAVENVADFSFRFHLEFAFDLFLFSRFDMISFNIIDAYYFAVFVGFVRLLVPISFRRFRAFWSRTIYLFFANPGDFFRKIFHFRSIVMLQKRQFRLNFVAHASDKLCAAMETLHISGSTKGIPRQMHILTEFIRCVHFGFDATAPG